MSKNFVALLALLALLLLPAPLLAEGGDDGDDSGDDGEEEDDTPPWLEGEGEDDEGESSKESQTSAASSSSASTSSTSTAVLGTAPRKSGGPVGIGITLGTINGFSLKLWPHRQHALVLHLGAPAERLNSMAVRLSYRAHIKEFTIPDSPVSIQVNLGPAVRARMAWYTDPALYLEMGGGVVLGAGITVDGAPAEIFLEVAPTFGGEVNIPNIVAGLGFSVDGMVGVRFYLGG
ncbi:MAG: hypothetical protein VX498_04670 [Myxococcota bacterium]|nr:hypothetical protein [Myxococcota bacterium]